LKAHHNSRPDVVTLDITIKEAHLTDVVIPNSHNSCSTIPKKLLKYTGINEELTRIWQPNLVCVVPFVPSTMGTVSKSLHDSLKMLSVRHGLYVVM
jgi:hypothetical protein